MAYNAHSKTSQLVLHEEDMEKLVTGLLNMHAPSYQKLTLMVTELTKKQEQMVGELENENARFRKIDSLELKELFVMAKDFHLRLHNIKKEMVSLSERSAKLKKRALKLHQEKQKEALERVQEQEAQLTREQELIAKPSPDTSKSVLSSNK